MLKESGTLNEAARDNWEHNAQSILLTPAFPFFFSLSLSPSFNPSFLLNRNIWIPEFDSQSFPPVRQVHALSWGVQVFARDREITEINNCLSGSWSPRGFPICCCPYTTCGLFVHCKYLGDKWRMMTTAEKANSAEWKCTPWALCPLHSWKRRIL